MDGDNVRRDTASYACVIILVSGVGIAAIFSVIHLVNLGLSYASFEFLSAVGCILVNVAGFLAAAVLELITVAVVAIVAFTAIVAAWKNLATWMHKIRSAFDDVAAGDDVAPIDGVAPGDGVEAGDGVAVGNDVSAANSIIHVLLRFKEIYNLTVKIATEIPAKNATGLVYYGGTLVTFGGLFAVFGIGLSSGVEELSAAGQVLASLLKWVATAASFVTAAGLVFMAIAAVWELAILILKRRRLKTLPPEAHEATEYFDEIFDADGTSLFIHEDGLIKSDTYKYIQNVYKTRNKEKRKRERDDVHKALQAAIAENNVYYAELCIGKLHDIYKEDTKTDQPQNTTEILDDIVKRCKELLCKAIRRDCDVIIMRELHKLWQKHILEKREKSNDTINWFELYRSIMSVSSDIPVEDWLEKPVFHRCLELGLIDKQFFGEHDISDFDPQTVKTISAKTHPDGERKLELQRLASKPAHAKDIIWTNDKEAFEYIQQHLNVDESKAQHVTEAVENFMREISQSDALKDLFGHECAIDLQRVGSSVEKTRCFECDEFDYMLIFHPEISGTKEDERKEKLKRGKFITEEMTGAKARQHDFMFRVTDQGYEELKRSGVTLDPYKTTKHFYMLSDRAKTAVYRALEEELKQRAQRDLKQYQRTAQDDSLASKIQLPPTGYFSQNRKFSVIKVLWNNDIKISIDVVPALDIGCREELYQHPALEGKEYNLPVITYGQNVIYTRGYSEAENDVICRLPENVRHGYKLAKAVRCASIFRETSGLELVDDIEEVIKTYYLKMVLLFLTAKDDVKWEDVTPLNIAIMVYEKLQSFVKDDLRIPHFFENPFNVTSGECLDGRDWRLVVHGEKKREAARKEKEGKNKFNEAKRLFADASALYKAARQKKSSGSLDEGARLNTYAFEMILQISKLECDASEQRRKADIEVDEAEMASELRITMMKVIDRIIQFLKRCDRKSANVSPVRVHQDRVLYASSMQSHEYHSFTTGECTCYTGRRCNKHSPQECTLL